jgi:hypothetical protein
VSPLQKLPTARRWAVTTDPADPLLRPGAPAVQFRRWVSASRLDGRWAAAPGEVVLTSLFTRARFCESVAAITPPCLGCRASSSACAFDGRRPVAHIEESSAASPYRSSEVEVAGFAPRRSGAWPTSSRYPPPCAGLAARSRAALALGADPHLATAEIRPGPAALGASRCSPAPSADRQSPLDDAEHRELLRRRRRRARSPDEPDRRSEPCSAPVRRERCKPQLGLAGGSPELVLAGPGEARWGPRRRTPHGPARPESTGLDHAPADATRDDSSRSARRSPPTK